MSQSAFPGGGGSPGSPVNTVQYNSGGAFGAMAGSAVDASGNLSMAGNLAQIRSVAYTWPSAQAGAAGQVLSNNGSGVLSWTTPAGGAGGAPGGSTGQIQYNNAGAFGGTGNITYSPGGPLTVLAPAAGASPLLVGGAAGQSVSLTVWQNSLAAQVAAVTAVGDLVIHGVVYSWPSAQATALGQVLTNNGSGILSWADIPTAATGTWSFVSNTTMADPTSGRLRFNNTTIASTTQTAISVTSAPGTDSTQILKSLAAGDILYIQDKSTSANWVRFSINGTPTNNTTWFLIPVTLYSPSSYGGVPPNNNAPLVVQLNQTAGAAAAGVSSFNTRTGAVVPASGDYSFSLISGVAATAQLGTGLATVSTFLRGDGTWATPPGGGGAPAGPTGAVQLNAAGAFGADGTFAYVSASGTLTLRNVAYVWPSAQGGASTALVNDGAGNLSWTSTTGLSPVTMTGASALRISNETLLTSLTGNARGTGAVDLQIRRSVATRVASGSYAGILSGADNTAGGPSSVVCGGSGNGTGTQVNVAICGGMNNTSGAKMTFTGGGKGNSVGGQYSLVCGGYGNTCNAPYAFLGGGTSNTTSNSSDLCSGDHNAASGTRSFIGGGTRNSTGGNYAAVLGGLRGLANKHGQQAQAAGMFAAQGDAQTSTYVLRRQTVSSAALTEMFLDGASARMVLPNDTTWAFQINLVARNTVAATGDSAHFKLEGAIERGAAAANTAVVVAVAKTVIVRSSAPWDVTVDADTTNGSLRIQVQGEATKTISWVAFVRTVEVTG